jgi:hypothetical protein
MRKIIHRFFAVALVVGSILWLADNVRACMCMVNQTVDIAYRSSPNVVILKLKSNESIKTKDKKIRDYYIAKMTVEKVFKGNLKVGQELVFRGIYSSCDGGFDDVSIGLELLTYLDNKAAKEKHWSYPICSRSGGVKYKQDDLKYIENIDKLRGKTRLSGEIFQKIESAVEGNETDYKPLPNRNIRVVGNGKDIQLKTDKNGFWEIYDLPPGEYRISIESIEGFKTTPFDYPTFETVSVQIKPNQHVERDFTYFINNSISGKFYDTNGELLKDVCLDVIPARGKKAKYFHKFDCTDESGNFKIDEIPEGQYLIMVNKDGDVSSDEPFGTFYYPNKINREEAKEITIRADEHIKDLVITAPTTAETITISGKVMFENGIPKEEDGYEYISVEFKPDKNDKQYKGLDIDSRAMIDEDGDFTLRVLKGQKGKFYAEMLAFVGDYVNCPKLDKILRKQGKKSTVDTNSIVIDGSKDLSGIVLKFPFPSCKKAKID